MAKRKRSASVKEAADRAARKSAGVEETEAVVPIDPVIVPVKRKRGRPSSYDPAFCEQVIDLGEQGKSKAQIAAALNVSRTTMDKWAQDNPDFMDAVKRAGELALAWWEDMGQSALLLGSKNFNATAYIFQMKNRFREEYRDASTSELNVNAHHKHHHTVEPLSDSAEWLAKLLGTGAGSQTSQPLSH
jgi:hypothetical protein